MCGIAGIKGKPGNISIAMQKMLGSMLSRGPDSSGEYIEEDVILGHRRLKVIDLTSQGDQPMSNENNSAWVIYNGEIYNFLELRRQLEGLGHRFKSQTDTEVILHSYEEWGSACLGMLRGMFAFGVWDKNKKELFLSRDRLGIKPLYYYYKNGIFIFASQVRAILASGFVPKKLDPAGLLDYLGYGGLRDPHTIIEDVYALLPGYYAVFNDKGLQITNYWDPLKALALSKPYSKIEDIYARINFLLRESINEHLVSDVPLGIFLSGGIDSSSLVNLAAKTSPRIKSVSLVFKEEAHNEASFSRLIAKKYHTDHHEVVIDEGELLKNLAGAMQAMDEPTFNGINTYFVSQSARRVGLTVALSGLGGDEVFAGYSIFRRIERIAFFCKFWNKSPQLLKQICGGFLKKTIPDGFRKEKIVELMDGSFCQRHPYFWLRQLFTEKQQSSLLKSYTAETEKQIEGLDDLDLINQISYLEMSNYMRDILLRDTDSMSMAHSLEVRVPFLDHRLIEFMLCVPGRFKLDRSINKPLLIKSLSQPLPEAVIRRKKMGFVFPFELWLRQELKMEVGCILQEREGILDEFLAPQAVLDIWNGFLKGRISWQRPWALYVLKRWANLFLE